MDGSCGPAALLRGPSRTPHAEPGHPRGPRRRLAPLRRFARDAAAVTPVVGTIMILAISAFGLGVVLTWGLPSIQQTQDKAEVDAVYDQFLSLEEIVQNVMRSGASGKASGGTISFSKGTLHRTDGHILAVTTHHQTLSANDTHRYRLTVLDDGDPLVLEVQAEASGNTSDRYVDAYTVDPDQSVRLDEESLWGTGDRIELSIDRDAIGDGTLRVRVMHEEDPSIGEPDPFVLMESWILPMGALEYHREADYGYTSVFLEMGAVVTDYNTGVHVHTDPLVRRETQPDGETTFLSLFAPVLTGGPDDAPLEASGGGNHPVRFLLALNMLQVPGHDAVEVDLHIVGPRADVWYQYFEEEIGFTLQPEPDPQPGSIDRATLAGDPQDGFEFVLMESRFHLEMQRGITRIG